MSIDEFVVYSGVLHRLTADFARAVPDDKWNLTPDRQWSVYASPAAFDTPLSWRTSWGL